MVPIFRLEVFSPVFYLWAFPQFCLLELFLYRWTRASTGEHFPLFSLFFFNFGFREKSLFSLYFFNQFRSRENFLSLPHISLFVFLSLYIKQIWGDGECFITVYLFWCKRNVPLSRYFFLLRHGLAMVRSSRGCSVFGKCSKACLAKKPLWLILFNPILDAFQVSWRVFPRYWSYFFMLFQHEVFVPRFSYDWCRGYRHDLFFPAGENFG